MTRFERVESLYHQASDLPEGVDPRAWLQQHCDGDAALFEEVLSLLDANAEMQTAPSPAADIPIPVAQYGSWRTVESSTAIAISADIATKTCKRLLE